MKKILPIFYILIIMSSCAGKLSSGAAESQALVTYARGDSLFEKEGNLPEGLRYLLEANAYAQQCDNDTLKARILFTIGNLYFQSYKAADAERYYIQALEYATASGNEHWIQKSRFGVAITQHALNQHEEAISMLIPIAEYARSTGYEALLGSALSYIGNSYAHIERYEDAISTFRTLDRELGLQYIDSCILLYSLAKAHHFDEYRELDKTFTAYSDTPQLAFAREAYYTEIGDKENLYVQSEIVSNDIADKFYDSFEDGILASSEEFFNMKQQLERQRLESQRTLTIVVCVSAIVIIVMILVGMQQYHRYRMRLKEADLQLALEQLRDVTQAENESQQRNRELRSDLGDLFKKQWSTLNLLCNEYFEKNDTPLRKTIIGEMEREIRRISEPAGVRHIADSLDRHFDNIITRLRVQIPDLNDKDIAFLVFSYAGFSPRAICLFCGYTLKYYYKKRAVMKERLIASGAPDSLVFVDFMG